MKPCIATGNTRGEIHLWYVDVALVEYAHTCMICFVLLVILCFRYDFARSDTKVVVTTFHWHAHGVADVCFTFDGESRLIRAHDCLTSPSFMP